MNLLNYCGHRSYFKQRKIIQDLLNCLTFATFLIFIFKFEPIFSTKNKEMKKKQNRSVIFQNQD